MAERLMLHRMAWEGFESLVPANYEGETPHLEDRESAVADVLSQAAVFEASDAARLYDERREQQGQIRMSSMPLVPPYPVMWIEYRTAQELQAKGLHRVGVLLVTMESNAPSVQTDTPGPSPTQDSLIDDRLHLASIWLETAGARIRGPAMRLAALSRPDGSYLMMEDEQPECWSGMLNEAHFAFSDVRRYFELSIRLLAPVCFTIQLLQARNVSSAVTPLSTVDNRRAERRFGSRAGGYRYHTLTVNINGQARRLSELVDGGNHGNMPLHWVRGHFKTYAADAPLFGKYAGTFFWPASVRGHAENGVVVKDYKLKSVGSSQ